MFSLSYPVPDLCRSLYTAKNLRLWDFLYTAGSGLYAVPVNCKDQNFHFRDPSFRPFLALPNRSIPKEGFSSAEA